MSDEQKQIDDGGPAFPAQPRCVTSGGMKVDTEWKGMTLRDYFAAMAMQGILSVEDNRAYTPNQYKSYQEWQREIQQHDAAYAYQVADAMLAARKGGAS